MSYGGSPYGGAPYGGGTGGGGTPVHGTLTFSASFSLTEKGTTEIHGSLTTRSTLALTLTGHSAHSNPYLPLSASLSLTMTAATVTGATCVFSSRLALTMSGSVSAAVHGTLGLSAAFSLSASSVALPVYSPIGDTHTIRYLFTTLDPQSDGRTIFAPIAELPCVNVTFSKCFNQAGPFSATINIEDDQVLNTNWIAATNPGKTFFWVLVDNQVVYGGRILGRAAQASTQQVTITGSDFYSYWAQRLQAQDYTTYIQTYSGATSAIFSWAQAIHSTAGPLPAGAPAPFIAWQLLRDAIPISLLPNLTVPFHGEGVGTKSDPDQWSSLGPDTFVSFTAPASQRQSVDSLVQQLVGMGYGIGIDIVTDVYLGSRGNPGATTNVCYPRYGKTAAEQGPKIQIMDLSTVLDLQWSEDATSQATGLVEMTGAGGVAASEETVVSAALDTHNYPLTELAASHTSLTPTSLSPAVLATLLKGDQDLYTYPQLAVVATVPIFNYGTGFSLTALPMGDDVSVFNPYERQGLYGLPSLPFPPKGSGAATNYTMRVVRADVTIADEGVSTMQLTLNVPPGNPNPPGYN